jgi:hypothetical protein
MTEAPGRTGPQGDSRVVALDRRQPRSCHATAHVSSLIVGRAGSGMSSRRFCRPILRFPSWWPGPPGRACDQPPGVGGARVHHRGQRSQGAPPQPPDERGEQRNARAGHPPKSSVPGSKRKPVLMLRHPSDFPRCPSRLLAAVASTPQRMAVTNVGSPRRLIARLDQAWAGAHSRSCPSGEALVPWRVNIGSNVLDWE